MSQTGIWMDLHARTPTQRLESRIGAADMSLAELYKLLRDVNYEIHLRVDGITPDANDLNHRDWHRRQQDKEIMDEQDARERRRQYWAGIRIAATALVILSVIGALWTFMFSIRG